MKKSLIRIFALIICLCMLMPVISGCERAIDTPDTIPSDTAHKSDDTTASSDTAATTPSDSTEPEEEARFVFNPKVKSVFMDEVFPDEMTEAWYNLIDAVYAGEDTFACSDQTTYDWMFGQYPNRYFPVFTQIVESMYAGAVVDGVATFQYKVPVDEAQRMIAEFETLVTDILNTAMKPEWTPFENMLSLYVYFVERYTYDYDTFNKMYDDPVNYTSSYRVLTGDTGICSEFAPAYSYLLMQAGIDATTVSAPEHEWSYVLLNGRYYHIDATFAIDYDPAPLQYFLMTDEKREETGFAREDFVFTSNYTLEFGGATYVSHEPAFLPIWNFDYDSFDHDTHTLYCISYGDYGETDIVTFDYAGY